MERDKIGIQINEKAVAEFEVKGNRIVSPRRVIQETMGFPLVNDRLKLFLDERTDLVVRSGRLTGVRAKDARRVIETVNSDPWAALPLAPKQTQKFVADILSP
ncbi:MAG: hypothetical protein A3A51_02640 [Candidatus Levybacteria bacterium RIFCSPLOWO2_01_FULL_39_10]|nr:MAG: hypothetical protein A3A51_02640 [Candidatus Levybacteria bacterium RIFCSPLOWO2_01_FULL_39_10]